MAEIKIDIINQMKDALIQSFLKDGIVLPVWHDAKNDPPKEEGRYLVCRDFSIINGECFVAISSYSFDLFGFDKYDFADKKPGQAGWYYYNDEWGYREEKDIVFWMPLPKPPKKEKENDPSKLS